MDLTKLEWQVFMSWAEKVWDQKEDWENYMKKWPENAWNVFKNWIDEGYRDYLSNHKPLQKDVFIRFAKRLETFFICLSSLFSSSFLSFLFSKKALLQ